MFSSRFEEAVCAEDGMDVLNALNFKEENLALDMILLGALAVGFRDDDIYLHNNKRTYKGGYEQTTHRVKIIR